MANDNPNPKAAGGIASLLNNGKSETPNQSGGLPDRLKQYQFKPGISVNPLGRYCNNGKTLSITKELRNQLNQKPRGSKRTYCELLVTNALKKAIAGDARLTTEIFNRIDGLPTQKIHFEAELKVNELAETLKALCNGMPLPTTFEGQIEEAGIVDNSNNSTSNNIEKE